MAQMIERVPAQYRSIAPGIWAIEGVFPSRLLAIQTSREGGLSQPPYASFNLAGHVGDDPAAVASNRQILEKCCATFLVWLDQVHGTQVADLDGLNFPPNPGPAPTADAAIAGQPGRMCAVLTADCLPILVAREGAAGCAAIHAGWRGLCAGVIEETLSAMLAKNPSPDQWRFWLGPCIGPEAFEVGPEVRQTFLQRDSAADSAFTPRAGAGQKYFADLRLLAEQRILQWFVNHPQALLTLESESAAKSEPLKQADFLGPSRPIRIAQSDACTFFDRDHYFSFRRDRETGRMASMIGYKSI